MRKTIAALRDLPAAFGAKASGARAERVRSSPQFDGKVFRNAAPRHPMTAASMRAIFREMFFGEHRELRKPAGAVPLN